jgi:hypothetical protein
MEIGTTRSRFSTGRLYAAILAVGGIAWTVLLLRYAASMNTVHLIVPGLCIVALWLLRAFNIGWRRMWIVTWSVSVVWHLVWSILGLFAAGTAFATFTLRDGIIASVPSAWVFVAFALSLGGLIADLRAPKA